MGDTPCDVSDVCSWINAAICRNAQLIEVKVLWIRVTSCPLPNTLFTCQVLVELQLGGRFVFDVTGAVSLPSLKTIHICGCKFSSADSAKRLFSSCPVLEELRLWGCDTYYGNAIFISVHSLKHLVVYRKDNGVYYELNNVPKLEAIELFGNCDSIKCYSVDILKSLRRASITLYREDYDLGQLLYKFAEVQFLSLLVEGDSMEFLARDSFSLPMFNKLTTLKLEVNFSHGWKFFPILLFTRKITLS